MRLTLCVQGGDGEGKHTNIGCTVHHHFLFCSPVRTKSEDMYLRGEIYVDIHSNAVEIHQWK